MEEKRYYLTHEGANLIVCEYDKYNPFLNKWEESNLALDVLFGKERAFRITQGKAMQYVKACELAKKAHANQKDKGGDEYYNHPCRVALRLYIYGLKTADEMMDALCAAMLHDVVEDTSVTIEELEQQFPENVVDAIRILTKNKGEDYDDYIAKIVASGNEIAMSVKASDLRDNMDLSRIPEPTAEDKARSDKYRRICEQFFAEYLN